MDRLALTFLFVSLCLPIFAQKDFSELNYNSQTINHAEYSEKIEFTYSDKIVKTKINLKYHWIKNQKVLITQGGYSGKLLHGNYEAFYSNKNLMEKGSFKLGLKDGHWIYWRIDGSIEKSEYWKNGKQIKYSVLYSTEGKDSLRTPYKNGLKHGKVYEVFGNNEKHVRTFKKGSLKKDKEEKIRVKWMKKNSDKKAMKKEKKAGKDKLDNPITNENSALDTSSKEEEKMGFFRFSKKEKEKKTKNKIEKKPGFFKRIFNKEKSETDI
jgi:hypothetical protein